MSHVEMALFFIALMACVLFVGSIQYNQKSNRLTIPFHGIVSAVTFTIGTIVFVTYRLFLSV